MTYHPGQTVYVDRRWPLKAKMVVEDGVAELFGEVITPSFNEGEALVIAVVPGPVREAVKQTWRAKESKKDSRGTALMLLLPDGQYGWIKSDNNYPRVTSE